MGDGGSYASYVFFPIRWLSEFFWHMFWCDVFGICTYLYGCKYCHELCYKAPISGMGVMSLWLSCWFAFQHVDHYKYCKELSYKSPWAVCFAFSSLVVVGVIQHRGRCSPKGEGSVTTLVKFHVNKVNKGKIITMVMGHLLQAEYFAIHFGVGVQLVYYG